MTCSVAGDALRGRKLASDDPLSAHINIREREGGRERGREGGRERERERD